MEFLNVALNGWLGLIFGWLGWGALILVIVLATRQANALQKNALLWAMVAAVAYWVPSFVVKLVMVLTINSIKLPDALMIVMVICLYVLPLLTGLATCYLLRKRFARTEEASAIEDEIGKH